MDIATVLEEYLADVASLPADLAFILDEIKVKDQKLVEAQKRIQQRDGPIQKFVKTNGAGQEYPKEQAAYPRIRSDFQECISLQQEKMKLATMGLFLMSKHVSTLDKQVAQLEVEGLLPPVVLTPEEPMMSRSISPEPAPKSRKASVPERRASRPDPRRDSQRAENHATSISPAGSRHSTPGASGTVRDSAGGASVGASSRSGSTSGSTNGPNSNLPSGRDALEGNGVRLSLKRGHQSPRQRPPIMEEGDEAFCYCKKGSVGNMIACDGDDCAIEWFHWECVGLTEDPKGSWYCPDCRVKIKKAK